VRFSVIHRLARVHTAYGKQSQHFHVALEVREIVIESATIVAILKSGQAVS
jgi:hypothetical protein